jgi:hypothetical protein
LRRFALVVGTILFALAVAVASFWILVSRYDHGPGQPPAARADGKDDRRAWKPPRTVAHEEWRARSDHKNVAEAVAACSGIGNIDRQPPAVLNALRIRPPPKRNDPTPKEGTTVGIGKDAEAPAQDSSATPSLSNYARAAIYLSSSIEQLRIEAAYAAASSHKAMNIFQWAIVVIGAVTTILISFKSIISGDEALKTYSRSIGFAAIFFSAIGTATAALNSFYGPREAHLKAEQSLATLRRLQSDIAIQLASMKECPSFDPSKPGDPSSKQVQDWKNKLDLIMTASDSGSATPSEGDPTGQLAGNAEP